ncbi:MAG: GWxTD domain-containing protein [bacterium]
MNKIGFKLFKTPVIVALLLAYFHPDSIYYLYTQTQESPKFEFRVEMLYFPDTTQSQVGLEIVFDVPYHRLQFIKRDTLFVAKYDVTVEITDQHNNLAGLKDFERVVEVQSYRETLLTKKFSTDLITFRLAPGHYNVTVVGTDQNSNYSKTYSENILLPDFSQGKVNLSSIVFLQKPPTNHLSLENILPSTRGEFASDFYAYWETVVDTPSAPVKLTYSLENESKRAVIHGDTIIQNFNKVKPMWCKIPINALTIGTFYVTVKAESGLAQQEISKSFQISTTNFSFIKANLTEAILPMKYIMEKGDWQQLRSAPDSVKPRLFEEFWERRDPIPETQENELYQEFYGRVEHVNRCYSVGNFSGWQTDRGRIYIIYGPPDEIDQRTSERRFTTKYEIWYYKNVQKRFIFQADLGVGPYRLVSIETFQ